MNFLEQLVAEWYSYHLGYFVRTNVKFGRRARGGYIGEMDVVAYHPETEVFIHIETSTDSDSWSKRKQKFERKFRDARAHYVETFPFKNGIIRPRQIAIVGANRNRNPNHSFGDSIEIIHIPELINEITNILKEKDPWRDAVPEGYPLLRAIQYSSFYSK